MLSADNVVEGLIPTRKPTESRYVLRLLRAGYVHVFIPSPPPGMKNWMVYRVTDGADLIAQTDPVFSQMPMPPACSRNGHNAAGMKLLSIPQAHKLSEIWISFSANLWSDKLKGQNAANPRAMQRVSLRSCGAHTFTPTTDALKRQVMECALGDIKVPASGDPKSAVKQDQEFPFITMAAQVENLADNLKRAAACHPKTTGLEMAVVLRDPVGVAAELNALRLRRYDLAEQFKARPENAHPLNSSNVLMGLKKSMLDAEMTESYARVSPIKTKQAFDASVATLPPGTEWQALTPADRDRWLNAASKSAWLKPYELAFRRTDLGRVFYPDHDTRAQAWAEQQVAKTWDEMLPHYDEGKRATWVKAFDERMNKEHYQPLAKFEQDWRNASDDAATLDYFLAHFDAEAVNDPKKPVCPGLNYAQENNLINTPAPYTLGAVMEGYLSRFEVPINQPAAVISRAILGNQQSWIEAVYAQLVGDPGKDASEGGGIRDKTYDVLKGLREKTRLEHYKWFGDGLARLSISQTTAFTAAIMSAAMSSQSGGQLQKKASSLAWRAQQYWAVHRGLEILAGGTLGSVNKQAANLPVLITMRVDAQRALATLRARDGQSLGTSRSRIKKQGKGAQIALSLLTDTDTLKAAQGDLDKLIKDPNTGTVKMKAAAAHSATEGLSGALVLSESEFLRLYAGQQSQGALAKAVGKALTQGGADLKAIALSVDGRLGLGSMFVQGLGLVNGLNALCAAKAKGDANGVRDALYGIYDSSAGLVSGALEVAAVAGAARVVANRGADGVASSVPLAAMRFAANLAGAAGGVVNYVANTAKSRDAMEGGDVIVSQAYRISAAMFLGTGFTSVASATGALADALIGRGIGGAVVETVALRLGVSLGTDAALTILGISVSGWGLILLGAGVTFQLGAIVLTPSPMQRWAQRSYFGRDSSIFSMSGKRDDMFAKGDWAAELAGLQDALKAASPQASTTPATEHATAPAQ